MEADKVKHVAFTMLICTILGTFLELWGVALLALMIGVAKELIWDKWLKNGCPDWGDILADLLGILLYSVIRMIVLCLLVMF